jgi:hypothetical protein
MMDCERSQSFFYFVFNLAKVLRRPSQTQPRFFHEETIKRSSKPTPFFNEKTSVNWIAQFNSEVLNKKNNPIQLNNSINLADENGFYFRATLYRKGIILT